MATLIGYAKFSAKERNVDLQHEALNAAGAYRIWTDGTSGVAANRPQWQDCLGDLQPGNVLVVNVL
ncbi:recombinase family protein [Arthrobacter sp. TWP1-1]|uniref:recombinase family protein n=1 Tax=Arthrobacter sp. TWP1-1 TaxID=2804568 RepID=UPI003CF97965